MRSSSRVALAGSLLVLLAACGGSKNERPAIAYNTPGVDAKDRKAALEVPPDLISPARDERYTLPGDASRNGATTYSAVMGQAAPVPAASASVPVAQTMAAPVASDGKIRIERAGTQRWLVVEGGSAAALWPRLEDFWRDLGFVLVSENKQSGLMETEWAENHAKMKGDPIQELLRKGLGTYYSTGERDKFRLRLETTATPGAVEIYISHRRMEEVNNGNNNDGTHWEQRPNDPNLEAEMLQRLIVALGIDEKVADKMVVEAKAPIADHAKLGKADDGSLQLTVDEQLDRAWRQIGLALDRTGVVVEDRDRAKGQYFVRYIATEDPSTQKQRESWFARLFSWGSKKPSGTDQFRVEVQSAGAQTTVRLLNKDGGAAPATSAKQILTLLFNELK